ncbi:MAG TPA: hypothetical protein VLF62_03930 [Candidatus Saccharimonadales bacterium]|nr:hypothetical protein [Candidatus Saccharimonadales bacterium]
MSDAERIQSIQAAYLLEAGYRVPGIVPSGAILDSLLAEPVAPAFSVEQQARLLAADGFPTTQEEEVAIAFQRAQDPHFQEEIPKIASTPAKAAKIAVLATFGELSVQLLQGKGEGERERNVPYLNQAGRLQGDPRILVQARYAVSQAILKEPGRLFHRAEIESLSQPLNTWRHTHEDLRNWWHTRLRIGGHALIIPGKTKGHGVRVNPRLDVTVQGPLPHQVRPAGVGKRVRR